VHELRLRWHRFSVRHSLALLPWQLRSFRCHLHWIVFVSQAQHLARLAVGSSRQQPAEDSEHSEAEEEESHKANDAEDCDIVCVFLRFHPRSTCTSNSFTIDHCFSLRE